MDQKQTVELADTLSRKRFVITAVAITIFFIVQIIAQPFFNNPSESSTQITFWLINVVALLLILATGGGVLQQPQLHQLFNDEVTQANRQTAIVAGYWTAMLTALVLFIQDMYPLTGQEAIYLVVSTSLIVAFAIFTFLEFRAHYA